MNAETVEKALVFDVKEFSVNDGPGARITVFLKGCPLRCMWCHNPEGLLYENQLNISTGKLYAKMYTSIELAAKLLKFKDFFLIANGGVTFSGGEATSHFKFLVQTLEFLRAEGVHTALQTSGYCDSEAFIKIVEKVDLIMYDLKLMEKEKHLKFVGVDNLLIKNNILLLSESSCPYIIRIPMIPTITDTKENLEEIFNFILKLPNKPESIELLDYNHLAPAKYQNVGMEYKLVLETLLCDYSVIEDFVNKFKAYKFNCLFRRK